MPLALEPTVKFPQTMLRTLYKLGTLGPGRLMQDFQASDCFSHLIRKIKQDLKLTQIHINSKVKIVNEALE